MGTVHAKEGRDKSIFDSSNGSNFDSDSYQPKTRYGEVKARVDNVYIDGLGRTKDDIIKDSIDDLFHASDFEEVIVKADKVRSKLDSMGCFSNIGIFIDVSKGPNASPDGFEVTFHVKELSRVIGGVNTMVGKNEGSLVVGVKMPNLLGRGERVQCEYSLGNRKSSNFSLSFMKPYPNSKLQPVLSASLIQHAGEFPWSGFRQLDRGLLLDIGFKSTKKTHHNLQWEGLFRETNPLLRNSSFAVRECAGPTMKSAIRHIVSVDGRDDKIFPTGGTLVQFTSELAGLGGSMAFLKNDLFLQHNIQLADQFVLQGGLHIGLLNDFYGTNLTEHFFIGGPQSIRGFRERGVGPQSEGNALGSNCDYSVTRIDGVKFYWETGLHLYTPLPFRPGRGGFGDLFRAHFFVNGGNTGPVSTDQDAEKNIEAITKDVRLATGLGVALRIGGIAKLELNYCFPIWQQPGDIAAPGVQFGLGINFL